MHKIILLIILSLFLTACTVQTTGDSNSQTSQTNMDNSSKSNKYSSAPAQLPAAELVNRKAIITTSKGDIEVEFYGEVAPLTVSNFIFLAEENFYDNLTFHRYEPNFVIQGGDPLGTGTGGPGYTVPAEFSEKIHERGALAMARLGDAVNPEKASSGSQFYITLEATPFLDGEYTVFGKVSAGIDIVDSLRAGDTILDIKII